MALQLRRGETRSFGKMVAASFIVMAVAVQAAVMLNAHQLAFAESSPLVAPALLSPADGAAVAGVSITNTWGEVGGAVKYEYQSFNSSNTNTAPRFDATYTTTSKTATNVAEGTVFYWRVRAIDVNNAPGTWSSLWKVIVDSSVPDAPSGLSWKTSDGQVIADGGTTNVYAGMALWQDATPSKVHHYIYKYWNDIAGNQYKLGSEYITTTTSTSLGGVFNQLDGVHHFCVAAVSVAGNASACTPFTITYDATAPTASFAYSNNNGAALTNGDVTVTMTTSEPVQTLLDWMRVDDTHFTRIYSDNDKYQVSVTDLAGNTSAAQKFEVKRIDRNAPTISGIIDGDLVANSVSLSIFDPKYEGYDGFDANHGLTVDGVAVTATSGPDKTYLYTVAGDGHHVVTATDKAGNSSTISFTIDTTAPTVANVSVDHSPTNQSQLVVSGTISDANLKDYNLRVYNADHSAQVTVSPWTGATGAGNVDSNTLGVLDISGLSDGNYWVRVWADDLAGNRTGISSQIFVPFTIDRTAPNVRITNFARNSDGTYTVTGTTDDSSDVTVTIDSQAPLTVTPTSGTWSVKSGVLVDGVHTVTAVSTDATGNTATDSKSHTTSSGNTTVEKFAGVIAAALPVRFAATVPFTAGAPAVASNDQSVLGDQTTTPSGETSSSSHNKSDDEAVKGASTTRDQGSAPSFIGLAWYWWLAMLAAVAGLWWLLGARRRKNAE